MLTPSQTAFNHLFKGSNVEFNAASSLTAQTQKRRSGEVLSVPAIPVPPARGPNPVEGDAALSLFLSFTLQPPSFKGMKHHSNAANLSQF